MIKTRNEKKLAVDVIFVDLDDTLISVGKPPVGPINKKAIIEAKKAKKTVILCTGRNLEDSIMYAERLNLKYHICFGGALVYDVLKKQIIYCNGIENKKLKNLIDEKAFDQTKLFATFHALDVKTKKICHFSYGIKNPSFSDHQILDNNYIKLQDLKKILNYKIFKINVFAEAKYMDVFLTFVEKKAKLNIIRNYPQIVEITEDDVNKGTSAQYLSKLLNLDFNKSLAFGDSHNDVSLFKVVKYGIAVGNAVPELKKIAFRETDTQTEQGVGKAIYKWVLKKKLN